MADDHVLTAIGGPGVVAVFRTASADGVLDACTALRDNGIGAVEITLTIPGGLGLIEAVVDRLGADLVVGAGTVLDARTGRSAIEAGASFIVSPGFDAEVVAECARAGVLSMPGCLTPTEVMTAVRAGAGVVKLFPARLASPAYVADLLGPLPGTRLMPTGGIDELGAGEYARRGAFAVGIGGRLADPRAVRDRDLASIGAAARQLLASVAAGRAGS